MDFHPLNQSMFW